MANDTIITVVGNLTADPELMYTRTNRTVVNFTIATTPRMLDQQTNTWVNSDTMFLRCSAWGEFAENIKNSLQKGMRVIARGSLVQRNYQSNSGENRSTFELKVNELGPSLLHSTAKVTKNERATSETGSFQPFSNDFGGTASPYGNNTQSGQPDTMQSFVNSANAPAEDFATSDFGGETGSKLGSAEEVPF